MQKTHVDNTNNVIPFEGDTLDGQDYHSETGGDAHFDTLDQIISQYYKAKSIEQDTSTLGFAQDLDKSSEELAFDILVKQSTAPRQILHKLNILENELATELENGAAFDGKYLVMLSGLKADLILLLARVEEF
jgi:hypothetical protein